MKTVITTLPIYKALQDQYRERGLNNGSDVFAPIFCPKHRLPSFQWMDDGDGCASVTSVYLTNGETSIDITTYFPSLASNIELVTSVALENYFIYNGTTLNYALPEGAWYLKITMDTNHIYYSDWFLVQCVYCNFAERFVNNNFNTFTVSNTTISSAIETTTGYADSYPYRSVYLGQQITVMYYLTLTSGAYPSFSVVSASLGVISNVATATAAGLQEITLTTTRACDDAFIRISVSAASNFSTSEILVYTQYACGYVTLSFSNCCNIGDILYEEDFFQTLWLKSDNIEPAFPYTEKGQENGDGKFIPTFRRQDKTYLIRTGEISQYMVDVLHRLKLHDVMTFIDQVGDAHNVESVDIEHDWFDKGKYYATATITIDLGEGIPIMGCC
jgi:hypothetical protein